MDLDEVADELYALDPGDFVANRDRRATELRRAGERELAGAVKALRRPSAAAGAVNRLARQRPEEVGRLVDLGAQMRDAQASLAGDELRALSRQRQQLVVALSREAARLAAEAGHPVRDAVEREVESTLDAALADPEAGAAVRTGRLLRALEHRGLEVDLEGAIAGGLTEAPTPTPATASEAPTRSSTGKSAQKERKAAEARRRAVEAARSEEREARSRLQRAEAERAEAEGAVKPAEQRATDSRHEVERLERQLETARRSAERAASELESAHRRRQVAAGQAEIAAGQHIAAADRVRELETTEDG